jgi:hypothetical protein
VTTTPLTAEELAEYRADHPDSEPNVIVAADGTAYVLTPRPDVRRLLATIDAERAAREAADADLRMGEHGAMVRAAVRAAQDACMLEREGLVSRLNAQLATVVRERDEARAERDEAIIAGMRVDLTAALAAQRRAEDDARVWREQQTATANLYSNTETRRVDADGLLTEARARVAVLETVIARARLAFAGVYPVGSPQDDAHIQMVAALTPKEPA